MNLDASTLIASLIWGAVGMVYFIYGKKRQEWVPLLGGLAIVVVSYFAAESAVLMSVISIGLMAAIYFLRGRF